MTEAEKVDKWSQYFNIGMNYIIPYYVHRTLKLNISDGDTDTINKIYQWLETRLGYSEQISIYHAVDDINGFVSRDKRHLVEARKDVLRILRDHKVFDRCFDTDFFNFIKSNTK